MRIFKKVFIVLFITAFVVMTLTQMLLKNSIFKNRLSRLYEMESKYVYSEKKFAEGYIKIRISNPSDALLLLQNGEEIAVLNTEECQVDISNNSVIEIDGRNLNTQCTVEIVELSDNIQGFYEKNVAVKSNIEILGRFFVK